MLDWHTIQRHLFDNESDNLIYQNKRLRKCLTEGVKDKNGGVMIAMKTNRGSVIAVCYEIRSVNCIIEAKQKK